jgi:transposase-like protein
MMSERGIKLAHTTILRWMVRGEWMYRYRAVDIAGETVDIFLSRHRDVNAAKAFLHKAMKGRRGTGQGKAGRVRGLPSGGS